MPVIHPAATVMVVRPRATDGQPLVYLTQRHSGMRFLADFIVFPGGNVDAADADPAWHDLTGGLTPAEAGHLLDTDGNEAFAYWIAALRELCEETGLLLATATDGETAASLDTGTRQQWQDALNAGTTDFHGLVRAHNLRLNLRPIYYLDRRIGPPGAREQYDTRYFLTVLPPDQEPLPCSREIARAFWLEPAAAVAAWERKELRMVPPTVASLRALSQFTDIASMVAAAATPGGLRMPSFPPFF